jgi:hypothetical protein
MLGQWDFRKPITGLQTIRSPGVYQVSENDLVSSIAGERVTYGYWTV